jgi:parallel beta-helix repeat protein
MRRIAGHLVVLSVVSAAVFGGALPAHAAVVACGDVITADTTLTTDLSCPGSGAALLVLADASVNLGGHTVSGDSSGTGIAFQDFNTGAQATTARVRNGRLTGFGIGVYATVSSSLGIERMHVDHTAAALLVPQQQAVTVTGSEFTDNSVGVSGGLPGASLVIRNSTLARNSTAATDTVLADLTVTGSVIDSNGAVAGCSQGHLNFADTRVTHNSAGVSMFQCDPSSFIRTVFEHNGSGIDASEMYFDNGLTIRSSRFADNAGPAGDFGDVASAQITGNVFVRNAAGLVFHCGPVCGVNGGTVNGNRFVGNAADGLMISDGSAFTVSDNVALRNGGWGLYADPAVTVTSSGNTAAGNGMPAQCSGIPCN